MRKNLLLVLLTFLALPLIGVGCNNQTDLVNKQQKQIEDLTKKVEEIQATSNLAVTTTVNTDLVPTTTPVVKKQVVGSVTQQTKQVSSPTQPAVPPVSQPVAETNLSNVAVALYQSQIDAAQKALDENAKAKIIYADIGQMWKDELIKNQVYLNAYPNDPNLLKDAEMLNLAIQLSDTSIKVLSEKDFSFTKAQSLAQDKINYYKGKKLSQSEMQPIFTEVKALGDAIQHFAGLLVVEYKKYSDANHNAAVWLDARHNVQAVQSQQTANELNNLMLQTDKMIANSQASLTQIQNTINSLNYAKPIYCTATNLGFGSVSVVCQ